jgi:RNA-dependent RNA polymerase
VLDGAKTGKTILPARYAQDRNDMRFGTQHTPAWKVDRNNPTQQYLLSRPSEVPFVMDVLQEATESAENAYLKQITDRFNALTKVKDLDLVAPWQEYEVRVQEMQSRPEENIRIIGEAHRSAMEAIKTHVMRVFDWCTNLMKGPATQHTSTGVGLDVGAGKTSRAAAKKGKSVQRGRAEFTHRSIETRQDFLRRMSREFVSGPPAGEVFVLSQEEVARLRASYAYLYDWTKGGSRFPWNVAFNELGEIKLRAQKDFKPISWDFYEKMSIRKI